MGILLLKRKWRELAGFATGALLLGLLSLVMVGVKGIEAYPNFVMHSNSIVNELPRMANWQGLLSLLGQNDSIWVVLLSRLLCGCAGSHARQLSPHCRRHLAGDSSVLPCREYGNHSPRAGDLGGSGRHRNPNGFYFRRNPNGFFLPRAGLCAGLGWYALVKSTSRSKEERASSGKLVRLR